MGITFNSGNHILRNSTHFKTISLQVNADRVLVTCGTHGGKPRCVMRDLGLLKSYMELPSLPHVATSSPYLKSLAKVHGKSGKSGIFKVIPNSTQRFKTLTRLSQDSHKTLTRLSLHLGSERVLKRCG